MQEFSVIAMALLMLVAAAASRAGSAVRLAVLPALFLGVLGLLGHPIWPVPFLALLLGSAVLWSLSSRLKMGDFGLAKDADLEDEPRTTLLGRALGRDPDTDPSLLVVFAVLLIGGGVFACGRLMGGLSFGPVCGGVFLLLFIVALLLVRRPLSAWGLGFAGAWVALLAWPGISRDAVLAVAAVGLLGAVVLGAVREGVSGGLVAVMLGLFAALYAVRPSSGLVAWLAGWALLVGLVLLYLLVGLAMVQERVEKTE